MAALFLSTSLSSLTLFSTLNSGKLGRGQVWLWLNVYGSIGRNGAGKL